MPVLAIDCAQRFCAAALYDETAGQLIAARNPDIGRGHAELLAGIVSQLFVDAGLTFSDISRIGVTTGPGSFAGIRVGVAFARGLAIPLGIPVLGISSLLAIAHPVVAARSRPVMAAIDAKRDRVWAAIIAADGAVLVAPAELTAHAAAAMAREAKALIVGSAAPLLLAADPDLNPDLIISEETTRSAPEIGVVAAMAASADPERHPAEPAYLRSPDAKPQAGFAVARTAV